MFNCASYPAGACFTTAYRRELLGTSTLLILFPLKFSLSAQQNRLAGEISIHLKIFLESQISFVIILL